MPKRPRSHRLEDESKNKLRLLLPERWAYRDKTHDYGIDGEVELFDENDNTTGLMCSMLGVESVLSSTKVAIRNL